MSRQRKKEKKNVSTHPCPKPSESNSPNASTRWRWLTRGAWIIAGPVLVWVASNYFPARQTLVAEKTYERAAGLIPAKLLLQPLTPSDEELPPVFWRKNKINRMEAIYLENVDGLLAWNPMAHVKNIGDELVDVLRIETRFVDGMIDGIGLPLEIQRRKTRWVTEQKKDEDYVLNDKLWPGGTASVSVVRGILSQLMLAQATDERAEREHLGIFKFRAYGRIVGPNPSPMDSAIGEPGVNFVWLPRGFPEERCKKLVDSMQPHVSIVNPGKK